MKGSSVSAIQAERPSAAAASGKPQKKPRSAKKHSVGGTLYRGTEGMWSWVLHRITGVAIFFFLLVHVLDTALVRVGPEFYNAAIAAYKTPIMAIGEVGLVGAIVYHAFNGLRVILIDFLPGGTKYHRVLFWGVIVLWVITMLGFTPRHLINAFSGH